MITIHAPSGRLLATQCGQVLTTPQGVHFPTGPVRWGLQGMAALWADMCLATGDAYTLDIRP
jgi:hypothetical protein